MPMLLAEALSFGAVIGVASCSYWATREILASFFGLSRKTESPQPRTAMVVVRSILGVASVLLISLFLSFVVLVLTWFGLSQIEAGVAPPPGTPPPPWLGLSMLAAMATILIGSIAICRRAVHLVSTHQSSNLDAFIEAQQRVPASRRALFAVLRIELLGGIALTALALPTFYSFILGFSEGVRGEEPSANWEFSQSDAIGGTIGVAMVGLILLAVYNRPHLTIVYLATTAGTVDTDGAADDFESKMHGSRRWFSSEHQVLYIVARAIERNTARYKYRLTDSQFTNVSNSHLKLSHRMRKIGGELTSESARAEVPELMRAAIAVVATNDPVDTSRRLVANLNLADEPTIRTQNKLSMLWERLASAVQRFWPSGQVLLAIIAILLVAFTGDISKLAEAIIALLGQ